jgi:hypothetical protein
MQATPVENSTVYIGSNSSTFRIWWNRNGCYWQTDIQTYQTPEGDWVYFGQAHSLIQAMTNVAITL